MKNILCACVCTLLAVQGMAQVNEYDVNRDGVVNTADVVSIYRYIYGEYPSCPDGRHPHMIDLGLPSGTKWACCNVGATKPDGYGGYYAWGETEEKEYYSEDTYEHHGAGGYVSLGADIAGTRYDAALAAWGEPWRMPTHEQWKELLGNTSSKWTAKNDVGGREITGANGNSIFLPAAGYRVKDTTGDSGERGSYLSATQYPGDTYDAYHLYFYSYAAYWIGYFNRYYGQSVRPVAE